MQTYFEISDLTQSIESVVEHVHIIVVVVLNLFLVVSGSSTGKDPRQLSECPQHQEETLGQAKHRQIHVGTLHCLPFLHYSGVYLMECSHQ